MKVERITIAGWDEPDLGILLAENDNWVLVKHIPIDYSLDGYKMYNKKFIVARDRGIDELRIEKVHTLKGTVVEVPKGFEFGSVVDMLQWTEKQFGVLEFQDEDDTALTYGIFNRVDGDDFFIDQINEDGSVDKENDEPYYIDEIRAIGFDTDYQKALFLLYKNFK